MPRAWKSLFQAHQAHEIARCDLECAAERVGRSHQRPGRTPGRRACGTAGSAGPGDRARPRSAPPSSSRPATRGRSRAAAARSPGPARPGDEPGRPGRSRNSDNCAPPWPRRPAARRTVRLGRRVGPEVAQLRNRRRDSPPRPRRNRARRPRRSGRTRRTSSAGWPAGWRRSGH